MTTPTTPTTPTDCDREAASKVAYVKVRVAAHADRHPNWQWTHERNAELIKRDGLMCEQHPGLEFDHDGCAGPGMAWVIEGRDAINAYGAKVKGETWARARSVVNRELTYSDDIEGTVLDWGDRVPFENLSMRDRAVSALDADMRISELERQQAAASQRREGE